MGAQNYGIDPTRLTDYAEQIAEISRLRVQVAVVIGGGNIFRGLQGAAQGMDRVQGDYMGMLATLINSMALQSELEKQGIPAALFGGLEVKPIVRPMSRREAIAELEAGKVIIISGGTGNPYFTTDTASALRGVEIKADVLLKGTRVDGVYTADPEKDPKAMKYSTLSFKEAYSKGLKVMDLTAFSLCMENDLPIYVFDMDTKGNLRKVIEGQHIGTLVANNI